MEYNVLGLVYSNQVLSFFANLLFCDLSAATRPVCEVKKLETAALPRPAGVELFPHNQTAYETAIRMLKENGRTAVIHPTGTGKSFIAFKLAEQHPGARVFWLSPSQYIFQTQVDSYERASGQPIPENISFCTYARLSMMDDAELEEIAADYIILDEFHRCGAAEWNKGILALLDVNPAAGVLGLSATHIRYLDNQRDMAAELFEGNIASEMSLGEAIARNILPAPKYVISLYSCQKELDQYRRRVQRANGAAKQAAEKYLEALRHALDRAEGLNVIFRKHMAEPHGKYLVFCANQEHLREMRAKIPEWFSGVDAAPHVYTVYSEEVGSKEEYARFMEDNSEHLKLLFCINMLNEGVHVRDVSGVILLRPTVSPIIYKQQIGRALSAADGSTPVIFDVVNNFENLYSISAIEQEMREIVTFYRNEGRSEEIIRDGFEVIDEVRECRQLFNQLEDTLSASWDMMYREAKNYYRSCGNLDVPSRYRTEANLPLGSWLMTQRKVRHGLCGGSLTDDQIAKLDRIGMIWDNRQELRWERAYEYAKEYYKSHGGLNVPADYETEDGFALGKWIANMRGKKSDLNKRSPLSEERMRKLEAIGMIWSHADYAFERSYLAAMAYYLEHGDLRVPASYVCDDGFKLGSWICRLKDRRAGKNGLQPLTEEQIARLDRIGMVWVSKFDDQWETAYAEARKWFEKNGSLEVPIACEVNGIRLGRWAARQRDSFEKGKLSAERKQRLDAIGMTWKQDDSWETSFREAEKYYRQHGNLEVPAKYVDSNGSWLGRWISAQRKDCRDGNLSSDRFERLSRIGMRWQSTAEIRWEQMYRQLAEYVRLHGNLKILAEDANEKQLSLWYRRQRPKERDGKLTRQQEEQLSALGM